MNGDVRGSAEPVATIVAPLVEALLGDPPPLRVVFWDGSARGDDLAGIDDAGPGGWAPWCSRIPATAR